MIFTEDRMRRQWVPWPVGRHWLGRKRKQMKTTHNLAGALAHLPALSSVLALITGHHSSHLRPLRNLEQQVLVRSRDRRSQVTTFGGPENRIETMLALSSDVGIHTTMDERRGGQTSPHPRTARADQGLCRLPLVHR